MIATRDYLSWSQLTCWERSAGQLKAGKAAEETDYYKRYILGESFNGKEMKFGKRIAQGLEKKETKDRVVEWCRVWLPTPDRREVEMTAIVEGIRILGQPDGVSYIKKQPIMIDEFKTCKVEGPRHETGKGEWTQKEADAHGQLTIYDMIVWANTGLIPGNRLSMIPTRETAAGQIVLTGEPPRIFMTTRTEKDLALFFKRLERARKGIDDFCKNI